MTEVLFYHLTLKPLDAVLPGLLERSLARGWRVVVQASSSQRIEALDAHLWTFRSDSFLPHGTDRDRDAGEQPILLTDGAANANAAQVRFLVEGAGLPDDAAQYERLILMFDGGDDEAVAAARTHWQAAKASGFEATYWQQSAEGRWEKKA